MRVSKVLLGVALAMTALTSAMSPGTSAAQEACSAAGLSKAPERQRLSDEARAMRRDMVRAAVECRFHRLERLALGDSNEFTYSYGDGGNPSRYWRDEEANGEDPMRILVQLLDTPRIRFDQAYEGYDGPPGYIWPSAFRENPTRRDWRALSGIYSRSQIREWKANGYRGHRIFIRKDGDWTVFVAGD